jgi:AraC-like DNA-binding protein
MQSGHLHHTVSIRQVQQVLQGARRHGVECEALLQRAGIAPALLESGLSRVTPGQYASLLRLLRRALRDEFWGLISSPVPPGSFSQTCRLLIHARTLGEALTAGFRSYHLLLDDFTPRLQVQGELARVRMVSRVARDARLSYAERTFCFFCYGLMCWLVGRRVPLLQVTYPHDAMPLGNEVERMFAAPLLRNAELMGMDLQTRWLQLPIVQTPQAMESFLREAPANLLVKYRDQSSLVERIRRLLRRQLASGLPSLESAAEAVSLSPQTLRRRLQAEGLGYQQIKDELRRDVAIEYLGQPDLTLLDIAARLGFSEASTFHRAFKEWTGQAPGVYRQTRLQADDAGPRE